MGGVIDIFSNGIVARYCDECQNFRGACGGGQEGHCSALNAVMKKVGAPAVPAVYAHSRADSCKFFTPLEFADYAERAVEAGNVLEVA